MRLGFLLLFVLVVFASFAHATGLVSAGDTTLKLVSNTDQCLTDCESWLEWDLANAPTNAIVPASPNNEFKIDFISKNRHSNSLFAWGAEIYIFKSGAWVSAGNFFGYNAKAGETYRIRVWGKREPSIAVGGVDWIPVIMGTRIGKWAWWNTSWLRKRPITLPAQNITQYTTIQVDWNASAPLTSALLGDIRVIDENTNTEIARVCRGNPTGDGNCFFRMPRVWEDGFENPSEQFVLYYNNQSASEPVPGDAADSNVCGFETGETCVWTTDATAQSAVQAKFGTKSVLYDGAGAPVLRQNIAGPSVDYNYSTWFFYTSGDFDFALSEDAVQHSCRFYVDGTGVSYFDGVVKTLCSAISTNTWYKLDFFFDGDATCYYTVLESDGGTLCTASGAEVGDVSADKVSTSSAVASVFYLDNYWRGEVGASAVGVGAEVVNEILIDVNAWRVDGFDFVGVLPAFSAGDGNLSIDFNVFNADNNRMLIDINFSTSAVQVTGTSIVEDLNLSAAVCSVQDWVVAASSCVWDWNVLNVADGNYYLLFDINGGGEPGSFATAFTTSSKHFRVAAPTLNLQVRDENSGAGLSGITVELADISLETDAEGKASIGLSALSAGAYIATVGEDGNYFSRTFEFDVNADSLIDLNVFVLRDINGVSVNFRFYDSDTITLLTNTRVYAYHPDTNIVGIASTNGSGRVSFFLAPDQNYYFVAHKATGTTRFGLVDVSMPMPIDEDSLGLISPFSVLISGFANRQYKDVTSNQSTYIFPNTDGYYIFDFNAGVQYYNRLYELRLPGNPSSYTLQAYLTKVADSGDFIFNVKDSSFLAPVGGVRIVVDRTIPGEGTVETQSITTDSTGKATIALLLDKDYTAYFYYQDDLLHTASIRPTTASLFYQVLLDLSRYRQEPVQVGILSVSYLPTHQNVYLEDLNKVDINVSVSLRNKVFSAMTISIRDSNGGSFYYDVNHFGGSWADGNTVYFDLDLTAFEGNSQHTLIVVVDVNSTDGNTFRSSYTYSVFSSKQWNLLYMLGQFADENNPAGSKILTTFLAVFLTIVFIGAITYTEIVPHDAFFVGFLSLISLGIFVAIGFMDLVPFVFISVFTFFTIILTKAVIN